MEVHWFEFELGRTDMPAWRRTVGVGQGSRIFVPAAMAGDEGEVLLSTKFDGTPSALCHGHAYVPVDWLLREFPATKEMCEMVLARSGELIKLATESSRS